MFKKRENTFSPSFLNTLTANSVLVASMERGTQHIRLEMWLVWFAVFLLAAPVISQGPKPHIIFILADDLGWNDVSFHGSDQIPTPNIDSLAYNGVILNRHYVQPLCTPSRSALMTGMYPISLGMQGSPMLASEPRGLPLGKILPEYLKDLGYVNRIVGKWHLGFYKKEYTPLYRGFDSHLGYWAGSISYYDHIVQDEYPGGVFMNGHDFRRNMSTAWDLDGQYATDVFTNEAVNIISRHPSQTPLFLYVSHLAVHAGNMGKLIEAPQSEIDKFRHIHEPNRRTYAAMVSKLDESVGKIMKALQTRRMLQNSIIVFLADNGAPSVGIFQNWGSNYPLRGMKATLWEGGVRGVGLVWSPLIKKPHRVSNELMHISDWLPTLYHAAGGNVSHLSQNVTGKDQWDAITKDETSPRKELLVNIDEVQKNAAIIQGDWKLIIGSFGTNGSYDTYLGDSGSDFPNPAYTPANLKKSDAWQSVASLRQFKPATDDEVRNLRQKATDKCNINEYPPGTNCNPSQRKEPCLFNLAKDPCEVNNVARTNENIARRLYSSLLKQKSTLVNQINQPFDLVGADPRKFNNTWSPWLY